MPKDFEISKKISKHQKEFAFHVVSLKNSANFSDLNYQLVERGMKFLFANGEYGTFPVLFLFLKIVIELMEKVSNP